MNPVAPHIYHRLAVRTTDGRRTERVTGDATYTLQLRAFATAVSKNQTVLTDAAGGVANRQGRLRRNQARQE